MSCGGTTLNFSTYVKAAKGYAKNRSASNEEFVRDMLTPLVVAGNVRNKNGKQLELDKSRVSRLLAGREDVPKALRDSLSMIGLKERVRAGFEDFLDDTFSGAGVNALADDVYRLAEGTPGLLENHPSLPGLKESNPKAFLSDAFLACLTMPNASRPEKAFWTNGSFRISLREGDLLQFGFGNRKKAKNIVVVPVNTTFETHVTRKFEGSVKPLVSDATIHGQWLSRMADAKCDAGLQERIQNDLKERGIDPVRKDGKTEYPIGSIAVIETDRAAFYLLAISRFNQENVACSSAEEIRESVQALLTFHEWNGQGYDLYMPLLGTNLSRANLSHRDSLELIKAAFIHDEQMFHYNVIIVVREGIADGLLAEQGRL